MHGRSRAAGESRTSLSTGPQPDQSIHIEAEQAMRLAIAELPPDYRDVIQYRYFEMKSIEETAQLMDRSEASVRALTDRAKKQLREALGRISAYLSTRGR